MGWYSEYYKEKNKDKLKEIEQNKDKKDSDETDGRIRDWGGHKKDAGNVKQDRTTKHEESKEIDKKSYSRPYWIKDIKTGNIKPDRIRESEKAGGYDKTPKDRTSYQDNKEIIKKHHWDEDEDKNNKFNKPSVIKEVKDVLETKKARKIEKYVVIIVYIIVFGLIVYFILASFFPDYLPFAKNKYVISADDSKINALSSFYIDDSSVLGDKIEVNGMVTRPIISPKKFNIVFKPKYNIDKNTTAQLGLSLILTNNSNIYLNDDLIFPNLKDYKLVAETPSDYVYVRDDILKNINITGNVMQDKTNDELAGTDNLIDNILTDNNYNKIITDETTENYIYNNFQGASAWSTRELEPLNIKLDDYKQKWTLINTTFRGNLKLAVYAKGELKINFTKQDLNWYLGQDEYTINITDYSGQEVYTELFGDDGVNEKENNVGGGKGEEQNFSININNLTEGVYYIDFMRDNYNEAYDSTLKKIRINSNKVLILGFITLWDKFEFYLKGLKKIGFKYWWKGKSENIFIKGIETKIINLTYQNTEYFDLNKTGDYYILTKDGYLDIYPVSISPSKQSWFNLPLIQEQVFNSQEIVVISKDIFDADYNELNYYKDINIISQETKISLRALEPNSVNMEEIRLIV